ncbi:TetR family transcriptional regulator [Deinococcus sp. HMF7620]|uniref:TetR family transcriptional regulator n=1 Tax=Deinococcus arboris TaxID=2682977 RepID=A0A7C9HTB4_9DEIO|nr:TetR/AcrR family transcriptional regulator [Deinococcus arboris]MVN88474.1 TetR family transcriptional regulator [Deinococcus arboris]
MARPRSADKRSSILSGALHTIASQGPSVSTAVIAQAAGVSNGSLFTYFETKADLLNTLYLDLKAEMAGAALKGLPTDRELREQLQFMWAHWLHWATSSPEKRRTLAHLDVSDEITAESRKTAHEMMAGIARLLEASRAHGPMQDMPLAFVLALLSALADTTTDFILRDPAKADEHCEAGFNALWRMLT